jgi:hypothetical protein
VEYVMLFFLFFLCYASYVLSSMLWSPLRFLLKNYVRFVFTSSCLYYLRYLCLFTYSGVQHILRCILFFFVFCHLSCQVLWIVLFCIIPSVFSNVYVNNNHSLAHS